MTFFAQKYSQWNAHLFSLSLSPLSFQQRIQKSGLVNSVEAGVFKRFDNSFLWIHTPSLMFSTLGSAFFLLPARLLELFPHFFSARCSFVLQFLIFASPVKFCRNIKVSISRNSATKLWNFDKFPYFKNELNSPHPSLPVSNFWHYVLIYSILNCYHHRTDRTKSLYFL